MSDTQMDNNQSLDQLSPNAVKAPQETTGTKIGEISEFEKALIDDAVLDAPSNAASEDNPEDASSPSMLDQVFEQHLSQDFNDYNEGDIVKARVRMVKKAGVLVDFSYKSDGFIPSNEISAALETELEEGLEFHAMIQKLETKEGYSLLSETNARAEMVWDDFFEMMNRKEVIEVDIKKLNQKGYLVNYEGVSGFLHAEEGDTFAEGDRVQACIINVDKRRRKVLFSSRNIQHMLNKREDAAKFFETLAPGDRLTGTISGIKRFGVFVNCGLAEGLVHISEISWRRISHPSDVVSLDQEVTVEVLAVDKDQGKLSLGMKQLTPDPWATIDSDYEIGQEVEGTVVRIIDFGAFVLIGDDLEGLVHISEVATKRIKDLSEVLVVGDKVNVKIIKITKHDQKIGLSLKHVDQQNTDLIARIDAI